MSRVRTLPIQTASATYNVLLGEGLLAGLPLQLRAIFGERPRRTFVVTAPEVWALWSEAFLAGFALNESPAVLQLPAGEHHKRLAALERLAQQLATAGADRSSVLIAFGGGVIGDVTGFLAAIYMRGIDFIQVPTTLLAQVDSSVGGKTGVNLAAGKNLIGSFHHPRLVLADTTVLRTLPPAELRAGLFESLKAGLIYDAALFEFIEQHTESLLRQEAAPLTHVIAESVRIKACVVSQDEREAGLRMILNFGHTVGHAIEALTHYRGLLHGEAVGWGMRVAVEASRMRELPSAEADRILAAIDAFGLPPLPRLTARRLLNAAAGDKKRIGGIRHLVLLERIGQAQVANDLTDGELLQAIQRGLRLGRSTG
ncbi:MAG: 3-dehydroquinate synthase [Acidobacteriaceae bacterium]